MRYRALTPEQIQPEQWSEIISLHKKYIDLDAGVIENSMRKKDLIYLFYHKEDPSIAATGTAKWTELDNVVLLNVGHCAVKDAEIRSGILSQTVCSVFLRSFMLYKNKPIYVIWSATNPAAYAIGRKFLDCWPRSETKMPENLSSLCKIYLERTQTRVSECDLYRTIISSVDDKDNPVRMTEVGKKVTAENRYADEYFKLNPNYLEGMQLLCITKVRLKYLWILRLSIILKDMRFNWYNLKNKISHAISAVGIGKPAKK